MDGESELPKDAGPDLRAVRQWLEGLQASIREGLLAMDPTVQLREDAWERPEGGGGRTLAFSGGELWEKAGVNFSLVQGAGLPPSATARRPELAGRPFAATGVSVIVHPRHPFIPTTHLNVRFLTTLSRADAVKVGLPPGGPAEAANPSQDAAVWWFGGGFDLTPYYADLPDARAWHLAASEALAPFGSQWYPVFKAQCDDYFYLPHRQETRGVGGVFFDDFDTLGWAGSFALTRAVGEAFWPTYAAIARRHRDRPYGEAERAWQAYRRGRYVEFNLLYDRGTLFGLQSRGRTESILISLPPTVAWHYDRQPAPNSPEAALLPLLKPQDWLGGGQKE